MLESGPITADLTTTVGCSKLRINDVKPDHSLTLYIDCVCSLNVVKIKMHYVLMPSHKLTVLEIQEKQMLLEIFELQTNDL